MKKCGYCKKYKSLKDFPSNGNSYCKECNKIYMKQWRIDNPDKAHEVDRKRNKKVNNEKPWYNTLNTVKGRCNNPNNSRYPRYGGRGIKCFLTEEEVRLLWFRDKAYLMNYPSIDRENNDGHYEFNNCRYLEMSKNASKQYKDKKKLKEVANA